METKLVTHRIENNVCVIKIVRKFISPEITELVEYITPILEEKSIRGLLINLGGDILIDSALSGFLTTALKECEARQIKYALCAINTDFTQISQNLTSDHFLGIFETEAEALKSFEERDLSSAEALKSFEERDLSSTQPANQSLVSKTRVVAEDIFYFIGPKTNWKFSHNQLIAIGILSVGIFFTLIGINIYQHFFYQSLFTQIRQQDETQRIENQELASFTKELEQQHIVFEQQIDQKEFLLKLSQEASPSDQQKDATLGKKEKTFLKEIAKKKKTSQAQTAQIGNLKSQHKKSLEKIRFLEKKAKDLEKQLKEKSGKTPNVVASPPQTPSHLLQPSSLIVDQFKMTSKNNVTSVQFNLRNTREIDQVHSGRIMIHALQKEELGKTIYFDRNKTVPFVIRRFRSFSKEFVHSSANPYRRIAIIVWDRNNKKFLEQRHWIE